MSFSQTAAMTKIKKSHVDDNSEIYLSFQVYIYNSNINENTIQTYTLNFFIHIDTNIKIQKIQAHYIAVYGRIHRYVPQ